MTALDMTNRKTKQDGNLLDSLMLIDVDSDNLFDAVFELLKEHLKFDAGTIYLLDEKNNKLEKVDYYNQDVEILTGLQIESGDGLSGWSADTAHAIIIADRTKMKSYDPETDFAAFLSVPILKDEKLYGVINLGSFTKNEFVKADIKTIESVAPLLSLLMKHYSLLKKYNSVNETHQESIEYMTSLKKQVVADCTIDEISNETSEVIHGINNSLSIIIGNLQCLLIGKNNFNQKTLSRLKKIETAAKRINDSNNKILNLNSILNKRTTKPLTDVGR